MSDNQGRQEGSFEKKVDEEWKRKVREEREVERKQPEGESGSAAGSPEGAAEQQATGPEGRQAPGGAAAGGAGGEAAAEPDFAGFVSGLAAQAFVFLGQIENPGTGKKEKNLPLAKHLLDTLAMLEEKTRGNLSRQESDYLEELLYRLRMAYVNETQGSGPSDEQPGAGGSEESQGSGG